MKSSLTSISSASSASASSFFFFFFFFFCSTSSTSTCTSAAASSSFSLRQTIRKFNRSLRASLRWSQPNSSATKHATSAEATTRESDSFGDTTTDEEDLEDEDLEEMDLAHCHCLPFLYGASDYHHNRLNNFGDQAMFWCPHEEDECLVCAAPTPPLASPAEPSRRRNLTSRFRSVLERLQTPGAH